MVGYALSRASNVRGVSRAQGGGAAAGPAAGQTAAKDGPAAARYDLPGARGLPCPNTKEGTGNVADLTPPDELHHGTEILFREWQGSVADLVNAVEKGLAEEVAPHGLALQEFNLLRACYELARECTATELGRLLPVDPARISRIVNTLVDNGLLRRRRTREDRRVVMLRLSEEGRELTSRILRDILRYDARLTQGVGADEMQVFLSVTAKIIANHAAMQQPESPGTA